MPLHIKSVSISVAVLCFFGTAVIGWSSNLSHFTCCKRALAAAVIMYITVSLALKAVNYILMDAMINHQMNQQKGKVNDSRN